MAAFYPVYGMKGTNNHSVESDHSGKSPDIDFVSKSQLKRDSKALQDLGKKLCRLNAEQLARIPLTTALQDAIDLAHRLSNKRSALKRHYQYIGKLLRGIDATPIEQAIQAMESEQANSVQAFKRIEQWRDRILLEGDDAIQAFCTQHEQADRQKLRQIYRNHRQANEDQRIRLARQLFKELRETS